MCDRTDQVAIFHGDIRGTFAIPSDKQAKQAFGARGQMAVTLADVGEFGLLDRLLSSAPPGSGLGDDCFQFELGRTLLAVTADPGPAPLTRLLGRDWQDMRIWGWYAALASASDLATVGAVPLLMTNCVLAPPGMRAAELQDYFLGFREALDTFGFAHAGGDLSSADIFRSVCTAVGTVPHGGPLGRSGCRPGDILACLGPRGKFATAFLKALHVPRADLSNEVESALIRPMPRMAEMRAIRSVAKLSAASDASDGLLAAIWNIAVSSRCSFSLLLDPEMLPHDLRAEAERHGANPWTLFFFWGDWQVVFTFPPSQEESVSNMARRMDMSLVLLGRAADEPPRLQGRIGRDRFVVNLFRNEHFSWGSYLFAGVEDVLAMMRHPCLSAEK